MPSAKSGKADNAVSPTEPEKALEADSADPGEVEKIKAQQRKNQSGKYGAVKLKPYKAPKTPEEKKKKKNWIEIQLFDKKKKPMAGEPYRVILPDGETAAEGSLDEKGFARVDGIDPGTCKVSFPRRDQSCWKKK